MSGPTWEGDGPGAVPTGPRGIAGWLRVLLRGSALGLVTFGGLAVLLLVRLVERPLCGLRRPVTPHITQAVCRAAIVILGLRRTQSGQPMPGPGAIVANHASWLDIFALNAGQRVYFVSKSEVAAWPGIGWLARATGTLFIKRDRREARAQADLFAERLAAGHLLLFFPEGTSTDGRRVLPFKTTLFQAFLSDAIPGDMAIQPVTLSYHAPVGEDARFYGWWGDMEFGAHLLQTLAARRQGRIHVTYHPPVRAADHANRKDLARSCETAVRGPVTALVNGASNADQG
ncbi:1-acyl-sn-glycerol-3-phosphate acyltransferase [Tropicimonas sp. IMCC34011]|uniref:lysophospholipid acyltransferase family protein n=1 Tax=Tropicimonas sp. IMCC34011 TaxID=2248759 RepID=UPI000E248BE1|nr:lysophospholipid acyltransferase family protein [Tropicimonas sp. IMCC34011]